MSEIPAWNRFVRDANRLVWDWRHNHNGANPPRARVDEIAIHYQVFRDERYADYLRLCGYVTATGARGVSQIEVNSTWLDFARGVVRVIRMIGFAIWWAWQLRKR